MEKDTKLSDLAKEIEYLKDLKKKMEALTIPQISLMDVTKYTVTFNNEEIYFDAPEAQELKDYLITIMDHGILRLSGELRKEI